MEASSQMLAGHKHHVESLFKTQILGLPSRALIREVWAWAQEFPFEINPTCHSAESHQTL